MIFRMPRVEEETLEQALLRVEREIFSEAERENFRQTIRDMYAKTESQKGGEG